MCVLCDLARTFFFLIEGDNFNFHFYIKEYDSEKNSIYWNLSNINIKNFT